MRSRCILVLLAFLLVATDSFAQDILTADQFFGKVSGNYSTIQDYEAQVTVTAGKQIMSGTVIYKAPTLMRLDFTQPAEQVIVYNGQTLTVYVPELRAVLNQQTSTTTGAAAASGDGLRLLSRNYSVSYQSGPAPVALSDSDPELVIKLNLSRKSVAEGYRTIILSIDPQRLLIRQMEGVTLAGDTIIYDFSAFHINQGIPDTRFIYDSPASANVYNNFLFSTEN
ncbi:MAG: outer membrane lipoprotein carrier protein LolA [Spirochaetales bacterium]|nr:MAG: outer membrane lipoprotein carrier protein LolA [Spirochaetales bacterium]